ncbi:TIGR03915 family putative DNA repair protein [Aquimarina agarivorans]|uniref:TIGR03915 family putative DNA repair protein n=1 Tax=Aquimarina agarivorans TaxID=980584 RepID=UPI000248F263|nr:TIGR03915 family putative DNA repair protein [Aquimarina agarivorans]
MKSSNLVFDGSFDGFLSAVFMVFELKLTNATIQCQQWNQNGLFSNDERVLTDQTKANRVWKGLQAKLPQNESLKLYYSFLSEKREIYNILLDVIQYTFGSATDTSRNFTHPSILKISQTAKMVGREKHRMEAFVRFKLTKDGIYFANISPDFNVLPLLLKHFRDRYADQKWIIYDISRNYGLFYNLQNVEVVQMQFPDKFNFSASDTDYFDAIEFEFERLWKDYYQSVTIKSRKNNKLHLQHVPKRYWKYLSEKQ